MSAVFRVWRSCRTYSCGAVTRGAFGKPIDVVLGAPSQDLLGLVGRQIVQDDTDPFAECGSS